MKILSLLLAILFCLSPITYAGEQGVNANISGKKFEKRIASLLEAHGFHVDLHSGYKGNKNELKLRKGRIGLRQPPYTTLYGGSGRSDFVLIAPELAEDVWIETKRMSVSGSLDEKLPHMFLNALAAIPSKHVIIIMDGNGWREGGVQWIRAAVNDRRWADFANYQGKRIDVMNPDEFTIWLDNTFTTELP